MENDKISDESLKNRLIDYIMRKDLGTNKEKLKNKSISDLVIAKTIIEKEERQG